MPTRLLPEGLRTSISPGSERKKGEREGKKGRGGEPPILSPSFLFFTDFLILVNAAGDGRYLRTAEATAKVLKDVLVMQREEEGNRSVPVPQDHGLLSLTAKSRQMVSA